MAAMRYFSCRRSLAVWVSPVSPIWMFDTHIMMMPPTDSASENKSCSTRRDVESRGRVCQVSVRATTSQLSLSIAIADPMRPATITWPLSGQVLPT